ncbi:MAG: hypothetical protein LBJ00_17960 [Planctomycetaceae bacterium]|nr:hypothetical protein [Planctomycetaceae bacterium]
MKRLFKGEAYRLTGFGIGLCVFLRDKKEIRNRKFSAKPFCPSCPSCFFCPLCPFCP